MIKKEEESIWNIFEFVEDRGDDGGDGSFHLSHGRFKRTGVLFGVVVEVWEANKNLDRCNSHEP